MLVLKISLLDIDLFTQFDVPLGQTDFISGTSYTRSASSLTTPLDVWSDGTKLMVFNQNRVTVWNTFPTSNNQAGDIVIGQSDFTANVDAISRTNFRAYNYQQLTSNGTMVAICDYQSHRVLIWNTFPTTNLAPCDIVLGQSDYTSGGYSGISSTNIGNPCGLRLEGNILMVLQAFNTVLSLFVAS